VGNEKDCLLSWTLILWILCSCGSNQAIGSGAVFDASAAMRRVMSKPSANGSDKSEYPMVARNQRVQGVVVSEVQIYKMGKIGRINVNKSVPPLDKVAIDAATKVSSNPHCSLGKQKTQPYLSQLNSCMN
jgi:TonB family protein